LIHDNTCSRTQWQSSYDFIVVGAGTAGAVVANKLSAGHTVRVLLLEAGGPQSAVYNDIPGMGSLGNNLNVNEWIYFNEPKKNFGNKYAGGRVPDDKGKTLGGCSAHNGMDLNRGNRRGYDEWANTYGAVGWSYRDVLPVFREWENNTDPVIVANNPGYHGTRGPIQISSSKPYNKLLLYIRDALNELGFMNTDINGPKQLGLMLMQSFITSSRFRSDTGNAFVDPNPYPDNLHIVCKALVTKILFNGLTVIGVEFIVNDISYTVYANREVIVSGGPINSPQLLMLSGLGHKQHLKKFSIPLVLDLPVGDNFQNMPAVSIGCPLKSNYNNLSPDPQLNVEQLNELYYKQSGMLAEKEALFMYNTTSRNKINFMVELVRLKSVGTIRLQSTSPHIPPIIDPNCLSDHGDAQALLDATLFAFYLLERSSIAQYVDIADLFAPIGCPVCPGKYAYECVEGIQCYINYNTYTESHPGGSCRMGAIERPDVVVDPQLRVKGANNLRVCDSSVFPLIPNANTAAASIVVLYKYVDSLPLIYRQYLCKRSMNFMIYRTYAQRQLIHDNTCARTQWHSSYDFIVVGAGTAGAVVANKLSAGHTVRVLLLEAGGPQSAIYNEMPGMYQGQFDNNINEWNYNNVPRPNYGGQYAGNGLPEHTGKTLGGSSAHNGMGFNRGNRRGYDEWANAYGAVGWSYRDVLPVFREWENNTNTSVVQTNPGYHGTSGPIQISSAKNVPNIINVLNMAANELGFKETDINGPNQLGFNIDQFFIASSGLRESTGTVFVDPNPYPDNLHIVCKALVTKILFNGLTAIGVEFRVNDISYTVYANREVIVSAGAIRSPHLLMLSGVGPAQHLNTLKIPVVLDLPVGQHYQNHMAVKQNPKLKPQYLHLLNKSPQISVDQMSQLYYEHQGPLSSLISRVLYYNTRANRDNEWPNVMIQSGQGGNDSISMNLYLVRYKSYGTIRLQSADPLLPPLLDPNWLSHPMDNVNILDAVITMFYMLERTQLANYIQRLPPFSSIGCPDCPDKQYLYECVDGLKCYIRYYSSSGNHPAGSCRMGAIERPDVVVDP
ncbi:unnamed protein product, partial [Medioppia subpectinata]